MNKVPLGVLVFENHFLIDPYSTNIFIVPNGSFLLFKVFAVG